MKRHCYLSAQVILICAVILFLVFIKMLSMFFPNHPVDKISLQKTHYGSVYTNIWITEKQNGQNTCGSFEQCIIL